MAVNQSYAEKVAQLLWHLKPETSCSLCGTQGFIHRIPLLIQYLLTFVGSNNTMLKSFCVTIVPHLPQLDLRYVE